jgi:hypothetical protein
MSSTRMPYLQPWKGSWRVRRPVPVKARAALGKPYLIRALRTKDRREAERLSHAVVMEFDRMIDLALRGKWPPLKYNLERVADDWFEREFPKANRLYTRQMDVEFNADTYDPREGDWRDQNRLVTTLLFEDDITKRLAEFIRQENLQIEVGSESFEMFKEAALAAYCQFYPDPRRQWRATASTVAEATAPAMSQLAMQTMASTDTAS